MMKKTNISKTLIGPFYRGALFLTLLLSVSCEDFVEVDPPITEVVRETVFSMDETATSALIGTYAEMIPIGASMFAGELEIATGLASDEFVEYLGSPTYTGYITNELLPTDPTIFSVFWQQSYKIINNANGVIEGLEGNNEVSAEVRDQLTGEALFIRAYVHFYLVNLFGPLPYVDNTDVETNNSISRLAISEVYQRIIEDLLSAQILLVDDFAFNSDKRVRANRSAATALLARAYLYTEDWANAELEANELIDGSELFTLEPLTNTFLATSRESIWQLATENVASDVNTTYLGDLFIIDVAPPGTFGFFGGTSLTEELIDAFETGDERFTDWVGTFSLGDDSWSYPHKYRNGFLRSLTSGTGPAENTVMLRLAEQYLIRAEARAQQGDITGAQQDINIIRNRAGLPNTTASDQSSILAVISQERRIELFAEGGHRWFDLKRTGRVTEVLGALKNTWQPTDELFPIPEREINNNTNLAPQNPGY